VIEPDNLDEHHASRIETLLDAFMAVGNGSLMLHESSIKNLAYTTWRWAQSRGHKISVCVMVRACDGIAYESWDVGTPGNQIHVFPIELGLLSTPGERVKKQIAEIQRDAEDRIRALMNGEGQ